MNDDRNLARRAGVLFIVATVASIVSSAFLTPLRAEDPLAQIAAHAGQVRVGVLLILVTAFSCAGIALSLYPALRRYAEGLAIASVAFRLVEGMCFVGVAMVQLTLISLAEGVTDPGAVAPALLAGHDWLGNVGATASFGLGALMYSVIFYRARLLPRWLAAWGLGAISIFLVAIVLVVLGAIEPSSPAQLGLAVPIAVQEMVLAWWLIAKGLNPTARAPQAAALREVIAA
jgi:hypothetical protein